MKRSVTAIATIASLALAGCGAQAGSSADQDAGELENVSISTYPVGSGTYNEMAAVSEAMTNGDGVSVRLVPSDSGSGRLTMLTQEQVDLGRVGEEYWYAFEGDNEFAAEGWGPTDVTVVWAASAPLGIAAAPGSDISEPSDLRGKRIPAVLANPSANNKMDAALALGGLTRADVEEVEIGGYSEQIDALQNGQVDAIGFNVLGSAMEELHSQMKYEWLDLSSADETAVDRMADVAPTVSVSEIEGAAGAEDGEKVTALSYPVPLVAMADKDEEFVYNYLTSMTEQYDSFVDTLVGLESFGTDAVLHEPNVVPFHPGLVRFLEEHGKWTEEAAAKNTDLIERGEALREEWQKYVDQAGADIGPEDWAAWKEENVPQ